jgi:hypothetical protein
MKETSDKISLLVEVNYFSMIIHIFKETSIMDFLKEEENFGKAIELKKWKEFG